MRFDFNWKQLIGSVAPTIATAMGGPVAGVAVKAASALLLGHDKGTEAEIALAAATIATDPESARKWKEAELGFQAKMAEYGVRYEEIAAADRADARGMQGKALGQEDKFVKRFVYWYAIGLTTVSFIYFFAVTFIPIDTEQRHYADIILGFLLGVGLGTIIAFFYGTSNGTLSKNKQIADLASKARQ